MKESLILFVITCNEHHEKKNKYIAQLGSNWNNWDNAGSFYWNLNRVQLIEYHDKYMRLGDIPSYAYENFMEMYDAYHALGGNGMITKMMHEIEELHLKKKEV